MPPRQRRRKKAPRRIGDLDDPAGFGIWVAALPRSACACRTTRQRTVENSESYLALFVEWCEARSLTRPREVTKPILERYQRHLYHLRPSRRPAATFRTQHMRLVARCGPFSSG